MGQQRHALCKRVLWRQRRHRQLAKHGDGVCKRRKGLGRRRLGGHVGLCKGDRNLASFDTTGKIDYFNGKITYSVIGQSLPEGFVKLTDISLKTFKDMPPPADDSIGCAFGKQIVVVATAVNVTNGVVSTSITDVSVGAVVAMAMDFADNNGLGARVLAAIAADGIAVMRFRNPLSSNGKFTCASYNVEVLDGFDFDAHQAQLACSMDGGATGGGVAAASTSSAAAASSSTTAAATGSSAFSAISLPK